MVNDERSAPEGRTSGRGIFEEDDAPLEKYCVQCETRHPHQFNVCPTDGSALVEADDLVGQTLADSYVVTRIIGEGGMGRIYEARHTRIAAKRFAIKTLHPELRHVPEALARFEREANAAAAIESPYVVGVFDVGEAPDGRPFLVSELLEGIELGEHIESHGKLPIALAVHIVRQVCSAVTAAHAVSAVHRDLKPENIFLTGDPAAPNAKVLDFGIAKFDDHAELTRTGIIMGTPSFMSPEQAKGERVDERCDVYAIGAILYAAVTGRPPYEGDDPATIVVSVMTQDPPSPRALAPEIPAALELVIQHAMARDRDDRFASAAELDAALAPFSASRDELAESSGRLGDALGSSPRKARPRDLSSAGDSQRQMVVFAGLGAGWLLFSLFNALVALVHLKTDEPAETGVVVGLAVVSALVVLVPGALIARRVRDTAWRDTGRRTELADAVRVAVIGGVATFGLGALLLRFSELILARGAGAAWPGWDLILLGVGVSAAAVVGLGDKRSKLSPVLLGVGGALLLLVVFVVVPLVRAS